MKLRPLHLATLAVSSLATANGTIIISEIVDGTLTGGTPKFVELTNTSTSPVDLSTIWIGNFNNGGTTLGGGAATQLSGTLSAGDSYVISYENSDSPGIGFFFDTYGFDADNLDFGAFINGDDVVAIFDGPATGDGTDANILDAYGVVGVDGTGEAWEYTDSYSFRNPNITNGNGGTFDGSEWTVAGANALEDVDDAAETINLQTLTTPGSHNFVPEPSTALLGALGLLALYRRKR